MATKSTAVPVENPEPRHFLFLNVRIWVEGKDGKDAYTKLCEALDPISSEFVTDTFVEEGADEEERDTAELWPKEAEPWPNKAKNPLFEILEEET